MALRVPASHVTTMTEQLPETSARSRPWEALAALWNPVEAVPRAVEATRWVLPLLLTMILTALGSAAVGTRLDTARVVLPKLAESGELAKATEREVSEQIEQAQRVAIVAGVAKGIVVVPLLALLASAGLWIWSWLMGGRATFQRLFTAVALASLPFACAQGITLASALRQRTLSPVMVDELVPSSAAAFVPAPVDSGPKELKAPRPEWKPQASRSLLGLLDFFHLWAALLLGWGFASAARLERWRGAPATTALYFLVLAAVMVGLPNLMQNGGPR